MSSLFLALPLICSGRIFPIADSSNQITLVNVEGLTRLEMAEVLLKVCEFNPSVVGVDILFENEVNSKADHTMLSAIFSCKKIVFPSYIKNYNRGSQLSYRLDYGNYQLFNSVAKTGFVNVLYDDDKTKIIRYFSPKEMVYHRPEYHFSVQMSYLVDSTKTSHFLSKCSKLVEVDYRNNIKPFNYYSHKDLISDNVNLSHFSNRIVLIGFLGPSNEDAFSTPLNKHSKRPDIYGVEYLAYIVMQILE